MVSFRDQTSSFFDELGNILSKRSKGKEQENNPRPYQTMLTQDDEPWESDYTEVPDEDPEVITRM
jgi:hypothetical protein